MTEHLDRILAALPHVWPLYVAFVLLLGVSYLAVRAIDAAARWLSPDPQYRAARERGQG